MPCHAGFDTLLASYPRIRPPLPPVQAARYESEYILNRTGGSLINRLALSAESWMHRRIARDGHDCPGAVLELGAGTLNHLAYEQTTSPYDIVEPFAALVSQSCNRERVRTCFTDIAHIPDTQQYRRILSIAVLEHLTDLPGTVARSALLLGDKGMFQAAIPSEGGLLWGIGWRLTTGIAYRMRNRADYGAVMRHEHLNDQWDILSVVRACFHDVEIRRFPPLGCHGSFYTCVLARRPDKALAASLISERGPCSTGP